MENDVLRAADFADGFNILDHADFVVHVHHRNEDGIRTDRGGERLQINQPVFLHTEIGDLKTVALQFATGVKHRLVLGLDGNDVLAALGVKARGSLDRKVIGLRGAGCPDNFTRIGVDERRNLLAGALDGLLGFPSVGMAT